MKQTGDTWIDMKDVIFWYSKILMSYKTDTSYQIDMFPITGGSTGTKLNLGHKFLKISVKNYFD